MDASQETLATPHFSAFQPGEKAAAVSVFVFASLSTLVLSFILLCVVAVAFSAIFKRTSSQNLSREAFFFRSQLGQYAACLVLGNWIRGVSEWIDIKWILDGGVTAGSACVAQGSLKLIGQFGSFFFIVAMGIHTFNTLVLRNRPPQWLGIVVIFLGWASALVVGLAPLSISSRINGPLYNITGISGFTCGISKSYQVAHMFLYFLPLFLASILSAIVYSLIFLMLRGTLIINGGLKIHLGPERRLRPHSGTFEEYQRFVYSVARTMLWLPISFVLALCPSSIMQLMDISGITVSPGVLAFSYILEHLDGVINVLILFGVLRTLGSAMKSTISTDLEKGRLEKCTISRPKYHWTPPATFQCPIKEPVARKAPPVRPLGDGLRASISYPSSLAKLLFKSSKKTGSADSSTGLLPSEALSRSPPPSPGFERPSSLLVQKPIAPTSVLNAEVDVPPQAIQKHSQTVPRLQLDIPKPELPPKPVTDIGLTPSPRLKRSRVSRDLTPISKPPTTSHIPSSPAPFLEVTLHSPRTSVTGDGIGSLISMYLSRNSSTVELPPFPAAVVQRDYSVDDLPLTGPHESVGFSLKAAVSIGAVGGKKIHLHSSASHLELPPMPLASPADSTDPSQYTDSEAGSPPPPPLSSQVRPTLQPTQPLRLGRTTSVNVQATSRDRQSTKKSHDPRNHPIFRALPTPPGQPAPLRTSSVRLFASRLAPSASSHSRSSSISSSSLYSYT